MTITYDERQRVHEMLDDDLQNDRVVDADENFRRAAAIAPNVTWGDLAEILSEHCERLRELGQQIIQEGAQMKFVVNVARRDPEIDENEPMFDVIRRLAARGDQDAKAILASFDSPLSRAAQYITMLALDGAPDWTRNEECYHPREEGGRRYSQVLEDLLSQADFDPMALLPDDLKEGVEPMDLMLALNDEIRHNRGIGN